MSLDLAYDDGQLAITLALNQFCNERCGEAVVKASTGRMPRTLWRELCELGVLAACTPEGDGGALEICAAMEALGRSVFPGPLAASFLAGQLLEADERVAVASGAAIVSAGSPPLMPFAGDADIFLEFCDEGIYRLEMLKIVEPLQTLGGEPWARVEARRGAALDHWKRALALYQLSLASYLAAAGGALIEAASEHARTRQQFKQPIGNFQAVAHPLADCHMRLSAASALARCAAFYFDAGELLSAGRYAAAARSSASAAALESAYTGHQVFGAIGVTLEGPVYHISRRIRQLASLPPGDRATRELLLEHIGLGEKP